MQNTSNFEPYSGTSRLSDLERNLRSLFHFSIITGLAPSLNAVVVIAFREAEMEVTADAGACAEAGMA